MDPQVKETLWFYTIWSGVIGLLTIFIRPFISIRQAIRDLVITFLVSFLCGLLLENLDLSIPVKCGLSGVAGLFGVFIYGIISNILKEVEKDPIHYIEEFKNDKHK